ncbi:MAG TPA: hypothetical protein VFL29_07515 [Candidatus Dormibacteraeota bacterium]|nr:hypothetical protein [Candidatus Dormibacteraeota bacterium]
MNVVTLIVDAVIVLWVLAVIIGVVRAIRSRPPRLAPLPENVWTRFQLAWERIVARFMYEPQWAVGEADSLVMSLLSARGHPLDHARLPREMQQARHEAAAAANGRPRDKTEAMRQVLLQYRVVFDRMIGPKPREVAASGRREVA